MSAIEINKKRAALDRRVSPGWALAAAALFLGSAALQLVASLQRWVWLSESWVRTDISIEDHRFDYTYPEDPWENLGFTAQLFGIGTLLLAAGILAMARAVRGRRQTVEGLIAVGAAATFGANGAHTVLSGLLGVPSPLHYLPLQWLLILAGLIGLGYAGARWLATSPAVAVACLFLLGSTAPGYLIATFIIAPSIAGYQSHDTTPWTETIVAASPALAGIAMLVAAVTARLTRHRAS